MKVGRKQIYIIVLELCALLCSALYLGLYDSSLTFAEYSRFGVVVLLLDFVLFCIAQKRIVTIQTLILMLFVLFQFGLPIVYAFNPKHNNFYIICNNCSILYFPARRFSHAQAAARVSSTERSAFQPSSSFASLVSAQIATTSPGRRGANL